MVGVGYFLGTAFIWLLHEDYHVLIYLTQTAFTEFRTRYFGVDRMNRVPSMIPWYISGFPINSTPSPDPFNPNLPQHTKIYQRIVGSINWLAPYTKPGISPVPTFLASYSTNPSHQHYRPSIHAHKNIYSTSDYGISYYLNACSTFQAFNHFPVTIAKRPTTTPLHPPRSRATISLHSAMHAGVKNLATLSLMTPLLNYSSSGRSLAMSYATRMTPSHGNPYSKSK